MPTACSCTVLHEPRVIVLTGGPGAGKTAVLELVRQKLCSHVRVLPEAASIVFGGGFPRLPSIAARKAGQRAIFSVQRELERWAREEDGQAILLCDRGTIDGAAYWPGEADELFRDVGTTHAAELARYDVVLHLRTPGADSGYDHRNALRIESAAEAQAIDERIVRAWAGHPRRLFVESQADFLDKAGRALALLGEELPACCRLRAVVPGARTAAAS